MDEIAGNAVSGKNQYVSIQKEDRRSLQFGEPVPDDAAA